jgi:hypothetical protein
MVKRPIPDGIAKKRCANDFDNWSPEDESLLDDESLARAICEADKDVVDRRVNERVSASLSLRHPSTNARSVARVESFEPIATQGLEAGIELAAGQQIGQQALARAYGEPHR